MMKGTSRLRIRTLLLVAVAGVLLYAGAQGIAAISDSAASSRPDTIRIESIAVFGKLERPAVVFFHDKHTEAAVKHFELHFDGRSNGGGYLSQSTALKIKRCILW